MESFRCRAGRRKVRKSVAGHNSTGGYDSEKSGGSKVTFVHTYFSCGVFIITLESFDEHSNLRQELKYCSHTYPAHHTHARHIHSKRIPPIRIPPIHIRSTRMYPTSTHRFNAYPFKRFASVLHTCSFKTYLFFWYWGGPVLGAYQLGRVSDLKTGPTHPTSVQARAFGFGAALGLAAAFTAGSILPVQNLLHYSNLPRLSTAADDNHKAAQTIGLNLHLRKSPSFTYFFSLPIVNSEGKKSQKTADVRSTYFSTSSPSVP